MLDSFDLYYLKGHLPESWSQLSQVHGQYMVNTWSIHGQYMVNTWSIRGQYMVNTWSIRVQYMVNTWSTCSQYMSSCLLQELLCPGSSASSQHAYVHFAYL